MNKEAAIKYLQKKGKIKDDEENSKFSKTEEELIEKVEKEGKIFGDPVVDINFK